MQISAWAVNEGDVSPSGLSFVSVHRDPARGKVRLGYSNGQELTLSGERIVVIVSPRPTAAIFHNGANRARRFLLRAAR
jgi:hypothetical protein